jgi:HEAT repeat protein
MPLGKRVVAAAVTADLPIPLETLVAELRHPQPQRRRSAARDLGDHPGAAEIVCAALADETSSSVREALFTTVIRLGTEAAARGLIPFLHSEDVALRNGATDALKSMPQAVAPRLNELLCGPRDVRIFGVEIVGSLAHPDAPRLLVRVIESDDDVNVCAAAVDALAECGRPEAVAPLRALLERFPGLPFLEFSVMTALSRIGRDR